MRKVGRILKVLVINVVTLLILLVIINQIAGRLIRDDSTPRYALPNYSDNVEEAKRIFYDYNRIQHLYQPFVGWKTRPYNGETTRIDSLGLRETPGEATITDSTKVVRFFGGSTMWGEGSDDHHTIPALYKKLNGNQQVFNHAQLAYNSRQNLDALITLYNQNTSTDIVVFYDGVNDAAFLCPTEVQVPGHRLVPLFQSKLYTSKISAVLQILDKFFTENIRIYLNRRNSDPATGYDCGPDSTKPSRIAEFMISNWEIAHNLVESKGGEFFAVLQPASFIGAPRVDHLELDPHLRTSFENVYRELKAILRERQYEWVIDLTDAFDGEEYIYIDFCHVSPNGNSIISQKISDRIKEKL